MPTSKSTQKHKRFYAEWFVSNSTDIEGEDLSDLVGSKLLPLVQELVSGGMKFSSVRVQLSDKLKASTVAKAPKKDLVYDKVGHETESGYVTD